MFYLTYFPRLPFADEFEYLGYAFGVYEFGVFGQVSSNTALAPTASMFFPPLYPYFLATIMFFDHEFAAATECVLRNIGARSDGANTITGCVPSYGSAIPLQVLIAGTTPVFVWATARRLSGSMAVAVFAAVLAFATKKYGYYANHFLTEALSLPLAAAFGWASVVVWQDRKLRSAVICAIFFGLLILTRAGWVYTALVVIPCFIWLGFISWRGYGPWAFSPLLFFTITVLAVLSPWIVRNVVVFDSPALTSGYGAKALLHRLPYNRMNSDEFKAAFIYWLPHFGDSLAAKLFHEEQYRRLDFAYPDGFYAKERLAFAEEVTAKQGDQSMFDYLFENEIIGNLEKHVTVTIAMVWRGMFVVGYWGIGTWMFFFPLLIMAVYQRWGAFIVLALPPLFMLGLNGFVSVSIHRYNMPLIPILAFSLSYGLLHVIPQWHRKRVKREYNDGA